MWVPTKQKITYIIYLLSRINISCITIMSHQKILLTYISTILSNYLSIRKHIYIRSSSQ